MGLHWHPARVAPPHSGWLWKLCRRHNSFLRQTILALGVLKSYEGMRIAKVSCDPSSVQHEACHCSDSQIDMHREVHISQVSGLRCSLPNSYSSIVLQPSLAVGMKTSLVMHAIGLQMYWMNGLVTTGAASLLRVTIDNTTSSKGHGQVVTSLMVGDGSANDVRAFHSHGEYLCPIKLINQVFDQVEKIL